MNPPSGFAGTILFAVVVLVLLFLILREFMCWYWKINQLVGLMTEVRDLLAGRPTAPAVGAPVGVATTTCQKCNKVFQGDLRGQFCEECGNRL
jgi:hypothetical protein